MSYPSSPLRAIGFALVGFTCWVGGDTFMKLAGELAVPKYEIMVVGGFGGLASIFIFTALRGNLEKLRPRKYRPLALLGLLFLANYAVWLTALAHLPLANFYTVTFLAPTVAAVFAVLFLKEALTLKKIAAILAGFIGVVIAVDPFRLLHAASDWIGYGVAFIGMFVVVAQMLLLRSIGKYENREASAFYPRIAAILGGLVATALWGFEPMPLKALLYALATGAVGGMGWMFMAQAYRLAPAATVAPFHYSQIISGAFFGYVIWHDVPSLHLVAGAAIIIASGLYILAYARKAEQLAKTLVDTP